MKDDKILRSVMRIRGLDVPSAECSGRLVETAIHSYRASRRVKPLKEGWLGRSILIVLFGFNIWMLYLLAPFPVDPALCCAVAAMAVGLGVLIRLHKRNQAAPNKGTA